MKAKKHQKLFQKNRKALLLPWLVFFFLGVPALLFSSKPRTVALLPFKNLTGHKKYDRYSQGIPETLAFCLAQSPHLQIVERTQLKKILQEKAFQDAFTKEKTHLLSGADLAITGSFQKTGSTLFLTARAIEIKSGKVVATGAVSGNKNEVFPLQRKLSEALLRKLGDHKTKVFLPYEHKNWTEKAYQIFLQGLAFYEQGLKPKAIEIWETIEQKVPAIRDAVFWSYSSFRHLFQGRYTGLVIDARHLQLERSPFPLIYTSRKKVIYGNRKIGNASYLLFTGLASYPHSLKAAKRRAGPHPLVMKASRVKVVSGIPKGVVVSQAKAKKILRENRKSRFLNRYRVAILVSD